MRSQARTEIGRAFRHRYEGPLFRQMFLWGVRNIPEDLKRRSMPFWAGIFYTLVPSARRIAERNLERAAGRLSKIAAHQRSFRLFVNYAQALTNMYGLHLDQPLGIETHFFGRENVADALSHGRGLIVVTGHFGFWQLAPFLMQAKQDLPPFTFAMAEEPNARVNEFERHFREKFRIVYTTRSPFSSIELASRLKRGELVGMQMDRHVGAPSIPVPFCGTPALFPIGPATLARATGAPIVPLFSVISRDRKQASYTYEKPIFVGRSADRKADAAQATTQIVAVYERYVRQHPDQWFNFFDFWHAP